MGKYISEYKRISIMTEEKKNRFHIPSIHVTKELLKHMRMPMAIVLLILLADQALKIWVKTQ